MNNELKGSKEQSFGTLLLTEMVLESASDMSRNFATD